MLKLELEDFVAASDLAGSRMWVPGQLPARKS
jgi:hypothetical protein